MSRALTAMSISERRWETFEFPTASGNFEYYVFCIAEMPLVALERVTVNILTVPYEAIAVTFLAVVLRELF